MEDSYVLKLSGKAELPKRLEIGHNFKITIDGSIVSETIEDNEDGTKTHYFLLKPVIVEAITEKGERLRTKDTRSIHKRVRSRSWLWWKDNQINKTDEEVYEWYGLHTILSFDEVMELLQKIHGKLA